MGPVGHIGTIMKLIKYARSLMKVEWQASDPMCRTICTIVGNYGSHMAFTTDTPFCMAYPLSFVHQDDPTQMTFRSQQNHPISFTVDCLLVCQLLVQDCPLRKYAMDRCQRHLLIPRGMHFSPNLFPQILIPRNHMTPYHDPKMREDAPFVTIGPFTSTDTLFHGSAGDLDLYTAEEVVALRNARVFKSSISGPSTPILPSLTSKVEPDFSTSKQDHRSSPQSDKCPVSVATGSCEDLDKSEHKCEATHKQLNLEINTKCRQRERSRECDEHSHPKSKDLHHECITGDEHSPHSGVADPLTWVLLVSVLAQRSDALREGGPTNIDAYTHQSAFPLLLSSNPPLRLHFACP